MKRVGLFMFDMAASAFCTAAGILLFRVADLFMQKAEAEATWGCLGVGLALVLVGFRMAFVAQND